MKKITFLFIAVIISITSYAQFSANLMFTARLTGAEEAPTPVVTDAEGVASFVLNATRDTMCVSITVEGLSGPITAAHVHEGDTGVAGPPIIPFTSFDGYNITATLIGVDVSPANIAKFLNGQLYVNVHTAANPGGEIRGQIYLETDHPFVAILDGGQEVPPVITNGIGMVIIDVGRSMQRADIYAQFTGLTGLVTGFSLYQGTPSVTGPAIANYDTAISGNSINIEVDASLFLNDLLAGNVYVNVLTTTNLGGEIRGQFTTSNRLTFDMRLDGAQETPPAATFATGLGTAMINSTMDTLWYDIIYDTLTAPATVAHFHVAPEGVPGPPVIDLTASINGNRISGYVTDTAIPADFLNNALMGNVYVNVHNATYPGGEIRGQAVSYAREGFTYMIDATQETPPTASTATGSGWLSLDREKENVHFEAIANGFSGDLTDAHFHRAPIAVPGPIVFPVTQLISFLNDSVAIYGDWTEMDILIFDTAAVNALFANELYINLHTVLYPLGEIRGQVMQGGDCFVTIITGVEIPDEAGEAAIYPVPSSDYVSVVYNSKFSADVQVLIYDISGREINAEKYSAAPGMNTIKLDVSRLNNGIYFLKIQNSGKQMFYGKLVKG